MLLRTGNVLSDAAFLTPLSTINSQQHRKCGSTIGIYTVRRNSRNTAAIQLCAPQLLTAQSSATFSLQVTLFDPSEGEWKTVRVRNEFPVRQGRNERLVHLFARPKGKEAWVLVLEKAVAKMLGGYDKIDGGFPSIAFRILTGTLQCSTQCCAWILFCANLKLARAVHE